MPPPTPRQVSRWVLWTAIVGSVLGALALSAGSFALFGCACFPKNFVREAPPGRVPAADDETPPPSPPDPKP